MPSETDLVHPWTGEPVENDILPAGHVERRAATRLTPGDIPAIAEVMIGNSRVFLIDFSDAGVLIETSKPPRIATPVRLKLALVNRGIKPVTATVIRCAIASLGKSTIWYRAGLQFTEALDLDLASEASPTASQTEELSPALGAPLTGEGTAMCGMCGQFNPARWMHLIRGREMCAVCATAAYGIKLEAKAS